VLHPFLGVFLRQDHRPYWMKKIYRGFEKFYTKYRLKPQFDFFGKDPTVFKPWNIEVFGSPIKIGNYANLIATSDHKIRLCIWADSKDYGSISIGNCCLICPGVRISSAYDIKIGDNCMIASNTYISDSDWHDIYNRISSGKKEAVVIENNVWIGDSSIVCKGVTIGENSIIGAGSVVTNSIGPNSIAAGNPAKIVKQLDINKKITTRQHWYSDPDTLFKDIDDIDRLKLEKNSFFHWIRVLLFPKNTD